MNDPVSAPAHYRSHPSGVECIDIAKHEPYCIGAALKYIWRRNLKGAPIQDLGKAIQYLQFEVERLREAEEKARKG